MGSVVYINTHSCLYNNVAIISSMSYDNRFLILRSLPLSFCLLLFLSCNAVALASHISPCIPGNAHNFNQLKS